MYRRCLYALDVHGYSYYITVILALIEGSTDIPLSNMDIPISPLFLI